MAVTIRRLVADARLGLRVIGGHDGLEQEVRWVAVSELPDPSPWLQGAELLLTSGMWLHDVEDRRAAADEWTRSLVAAGARAVGFGIEPWFSAVPDELVRAARRRRLTLLEVPTRTPFLAVDRTVADLHAAEAVRQAAEAARIQQRLAEAGRAGRGAVATRLARELRGWVAVLDAGHDVVIRTPDDRAPRGELLIDLARRADRSARHSLLADLDGEPVSVVTLGPARERVGTLCVGAAALQAQPAWASGVVGTAAALMSVLDPVGDTASRSAVASLLVSGEVVAAERLAAAVGQVLPQRFVAVALSGPGRREAAARVVAAGGWRVPSGDAGGPVVLTAPGIVDERLETMLHDASACAGISAPHFAEDAATAVHEARSAASLASGRRVLVRYCETASMELDSVLRSELTTAFASALLAPLTGERAGAVLLASARAWTACNGRWDPAAAKLGVHRETLRTRMDRLADLLGLDLDRAQDRLALALALEADRHHRT
jgi:purine catabolism regulator